jgi:cyanuric acid amidohydrolase
MLKLGLPPDGVLRGRRTTVLTGALPMDSHLRAAASGLVGALCGDTRFYISADPMHHAPPGGGIAACIARCPR